jgi:hypothetical protein
MSKGKNEVHADKINDIDSDDEDAGNVIKDMIKDPKKVAEALKGMKIDAGAMRNIIKDVQNDPEAAKEIEKMSKESNLKDTLLKSMKNSGANQPKLKDLRKAKKGMKKAMSEGSSLTSTPKFGIKIMASRKAKNINIDENPFITAEKFFGDSDITECHDLSDKCDGVVVLYCHSRKGKNKRINDLLGEGYGTEIIIYSTLCDFEESDLISIEKIIAKGG